LVASGAGNSISNQFLWDLKSTSEQVTYDILILNAQNASTEQAIITVPNIAGFQNPEVSVVYMQRMYQPIYEGVSLPKHLIAASVAKNEIFLNDATKTGNYNFELIVRITYNLN
jgi:hypothetical protein